MPSDNSENEPQVKVEDHSKGGDPIQKGGDGDISDGPVKNRGCTDILCLLLFIAHWAAFAFVAGEGFKDGDGRRVVFPNDNLGRVCGATNDVALKFGNYSSDFSDFRHLGFTMNAEKMFGPGVKKVMCTQTSRNPSFETLLNSANKCLAGSACRENWGTACAQTDEGPKLDIDEFVANPAGALKNFFEASGEDNPIKSFSEYLHHSCIKSCDDMNKYSVDNETGGRPWQLDFDKDNLWAQAWHEIVALKDDPSMPPAFNVFNSITVKALPGTICPYPTRYCIFFPGFKTAPIARRCLMQMSTLSNIANAALKNGLTKKVGGGFGDAVGQIADTWYVFIIVGIVTLVIGVIFLIILRFTVCFFVWLSIIATFLALVGAGGYSVWYSMACEGDSVESTARETAANMGFGDFGACDSGAYKENDENLRKAYLIIGCVALSVAALYVLIVVCSLKRIRLAIILNKVAARFVYNNKKIIFVPVVQILFALLWWALWLACAVYAISNTVLNKESYTQEKAAGTADTPGSCTNKWPAAPVWKDIDNPVCTCADVMNCDVASLECFRCGQPRFNITERFWYLLFSLLWNNAALVAIGQMTVAGAAGVWYFNQNNLSEVYPVKTGLANCFRYHLGSIAFGSFILAIVQLVKWWLRYWQKQLEAQKQNLMAKIAFLMAYCVHCFERCIKFLNKNAYIRVALTGENFCKAAWKAFQLIIRNIGRYAVVGGLGSVISRLGTLFICAASGFSGYLIFVALEPAQNPWLCVAVYLIMGYVGGRLVMNVFGLAVDSILVCFVTDEEINGDALHGPEEVHDFYECAEEYEKRKLEKNSGKENVTNNNDVSAVPC